MVWALTYWSKSRTISFGDESELGWRQGVREESEGYMFDRAALSRVTVVEVSTSSLVEKLGAGGELVAGGGSGFRLMGGIERSCGGSVV